VIIRPSSFSETAQATYANGVTSTFAWYAPRAWLSTLTHARAATTLKAKTYAHDPGGRIISILAGEGRRP
jgi:hypothetical protein